MATTTTRTTTAREVFFDGTVETAGRVLAACENINRPIKIVSHRQLDEVEREFLRELEDCTGSIGDFVYGRYVKRERQGSARPCEEVVEDGVDAFFERAGNMMEENEEATVEMLGRLRACHAGSCQACERCEHVAATAEEYGIYDVFDLLRSSE